MNGQGFAGIDWKGDKNARGLSKVMSSPTQALYSAFLVSDRNTGSNFLLRAGDLLAQGDDRLLPVPLYDHHLVPPCTHPLAPRYDLHHDCIFRRPRQPGGPAQNSLLRRPCGWLLCAD